MINNSLFLNLKNKNLFMSAIKELDKINIDNNQYELNNKLLGLRSNIKKVLLVQPIQIQEKKLDIRIAKNKRYYMYPPYGLGILNAILKKNKIESKILDLNFEVFNFLKKKFVKSCENLLLYLYNV